MATPKGGKPIEQAVIDAVSSRVNGVVRSVRQLIAGVNEAWMGPNQPIAPVAQAEAHGRVTDYPFGWNVTPTPRGETDSGDGTTSVDFPTLRQMADPGAGGLDLLRVAIETRKDQMAAQPWTIRERVDKRTQARTRAKALAIGKKKLEEQQAAQLKAQQDAMAAKPAAGAAEATKAAKPAPAAEPTDEELGLPPESPAEKKAAQIEQLLRTPDGVNAFTSWQRKLMEDLLVIDAPCVYLRPVTGQTYRLPDVVDGATIKPLVDGNGRTPLPPNPAYGQYLRGVQATQYSLDDLVYFPRNVRSNKFYGYSPVEQVITTVNIALRRQLMQLMHYTEGNIPEAFVPTPPEWTLQQVKDFQEYWDSTLEGNQASKSHAKFVPAGVAPIFTRDAKLKDEWDEWLARIICWCFSLSPQALVKQMNRGTGETAKQTAQEEGLEPLKLWWKAFMDLVLAKAFNAPELEFAFEDEEIGDPLVKAQVVALLVDKVFTSNELREWYGKEPRADLEKPMAPPPGIAFGGAGGPSAASGGHPPPASEKLERLLRGLLRKAHQADRP